MQKPTKWPHIRLILLGDSGVGKTSFLKALSRMKSRGRGESLLLLFFFFFNFLGIVGFLVFLSLIIFI